MKKFLACKTLSIIGLLIIVIALALVLFHKPIVEALTRQVIHSALAHKKMHFEDGLYAGLCGSGSPMPDMNRAGPCVAVLAGNNFFIVDAGEGSTKNISLMNLPTREIDAILLTHFHSD